MGEGTDVGAQIPGFGESLRGERGVYGLFKVFMSVHVTIICVAGGLACLCIEPNHRVDGFFPLFVSS